MDRLEYEFFDNGTVKIRKNRSKTDVKRVSGGSKGVKLLPRRSLAKEAKKILDVECKT